MAIRDTDACCSRCRTPSGICATGRTCGHHLEARLMDEAGRTSYSDPTGNRAVGNIMRDQRRQRRKER